MIELAFTIALGIVLAVLILNFLPDILQLGFALALAVVAITVPLFLLYLIAPTVVQTMDLLGVWMLVFSPFPLIAFFLFIDYLIWNELEKSKKENEQKPFYFFKRYKHALKMIGKRFILGTAYFVISIAGLFYLPTLSTYNNNLFIFIGGLVYIAILYTLFHALIKTSPTASQA